MRAKRKRMMIYNIATKKAMKYVKTNKITGHTENLAVSVSKWYHILDTKTSQYKRLK